MKIDPFKPFWDGPLLGGLKRKFFAVFVLWSIIIFILWIWFHNHELHDALLGNNTSYSGLVFLFFWASGLVVQFFSFISLCKHDVSRHEMDLALQKSNLLPQQEQEMFTSGPIIIFRWKNEANWPVEYVSPNVEEVFGYSADEFTSGSVLYGGIIPEADQGRVGEEVVAASEGGVKSFTHAPYRITRKDGNVVWVDDHTTVIRDENGVVTHYQGYIIDVSQRKSADLERESAQQFTQMVIDSLPERMLVINLDYSIALANRALLEGAESIDRLISSHTCYQLSHGTDKPCHGEDHQCPFTTVLSTKKPARVEHNHLGPSGENLVVEVIAAPIFGADGEVVQVIETFRDVTDRKKMEEAKFDLERQLLHTQKLESLGVLAGGIAHDFNNLLMAILGNADLALLEMSPLSPSRKNIEEIEKASRRAADLAKQMLAYSGKGRFVLEPIDAGELLSEMAHLLEVSISKNVVLKYNFADNLPAFMGDATQIRQVVMNLITNASEAIDGKSGVIALSTGAMDCDREYLERTSDFQGVAIEGALTEGLFVYFEVADTGCGMDSETIARIFDPFFTTKFTGRGLGMSALQGIVRGHGGTIKIYSEKGKGTTFKVLFPVGELDGVLTDKENTVTLAQEKWKGEGTILIADDEETVLAVGRRMLEHMGFDVLTAADGREAMKVFREHADQIVCVLLDLTMPHMNGVEVFREMRRFHPNVTVILCSGYNEQDAVQHFIGKGLAGFIQKPYTLALLREKLIGAIG
jgi:PAS domain S-box-containing protein